MTDKQSPFPATVDESIRLLASLVPEDEQAKIAAMQETNLVELHFGLGQRVRNHLGLWDADSVLLKATGQCNTDDASDRSFWRSGRNCEMDCRKFIDSLMHLPSVMVCSL